MNYMTPTLAGCLLACADAGTVNIHPRKRGRWRALAAGEFLPYRAETFLRLIGLGMLKFEGANHVVLTPLGQDFVDQAPASLRIARGTE